MDFSPLWKSLCIFKTVILMQCLSQSIQCLHWEGFHSAWAFMRIFKLFPLENVLAHSSHAEALSLVGSDHVDLQTLPTQEKFGTKFAFDSTFSSVIFKVRLHVFPSKKRLNTL